MKKIILVASIILLLAAVVGVAASAVGQRRGAEGNDTAEENPASGERWEYLVVTGAHNNLTPTNNSSLRKDHTGAFRGEAFVVEQSLDKLGAKGWELVSVTGSPTDPIYYLKRRR
ncbi:MAG TPA: hypothetical protein VJQ56_12560 [Blastocatellia bacterium]|nr:hypothetical protein [Blastocatellia bacterium]